MGSSSPREVIVSTARHASSWEGVSSLVDYLHRTQAFGAADLFGAGEVSPLVLALLRASKRDAKVFLDPLFLADIPKLGGIQAFMTQDDEGESAFGHAFERIVAEQLWEGAGPFVDLFPMRAFSEFKRPDFPKWRLNEGIMKWNKMAPRTSASPPHDFLDRWIAKGASLIGERSCGMPLATLLRLPSHWNAFLAQGGDPLQVFSGDDASGRSPWTIAEWLVYHAESDLRATVATWASQHAPSLEEKIKERKYFNALSQNHGSLETLRKALVDHSRWDHLRDHEGRTGLMVAISRHASAHNAPTPTRIKRLFSERDRLGRSLVYHALMGPVACSTEKMDAILATPGVVLPSEETGRGLLAQIVFTPLARLPSPLTAIDRVLSWALPRDILAMPEGDEEKMVRWVAEKMNLRHPPSEATHAFLFATIIEKWPNMPLSPSLAGVFTLCLACTSKTPRQWELVEALIDKGAVLPLMPPDRASEFAKLMGKDKWPKFQALAQSREIATATPATPSRANARL